MDFHGVYLCVCRGIATMQVNVPSKMRLKLAATVESIVNQSHKVMNKYEVEHLVQQLVRGGATALEPELVSYVGDP